MSVSKSGDDVMPGLAISAWLEGPSPCMARLGNFSPGDPAPGLTCRHGRRASEVAFLAHSTGLWVLTPENKMLLA